MGRMILTSIREVKPASRNLQLKLLQHLWVSQKKVLKLGTFEVNIILAVVLDFRRRQTRFWNSAK